MWEHGAADSLFALLFGVELERASRNWSRIRRASFANGCLLTASVLLLCLFGETLLPPLAALRQCCGERSWIIGKLLLGLLALPVGFPAGYFLTRRRLLRRAGEPGVERPPDPVQARARQIQRVYEVGTGLLLWAWFWFLTPARSWAEQGGQAMPARMMGLLAVWLVLAALLGIAGGRLVRRRAEHSLRRRM